LKQTSARLSLMKASRADLQKDDDPFIKLAVSLLDGDLDLEEQRKDREGRLEAARAKAMEARIAWMRSQGRPLYPDANGTLRLSFGPVRGYKPRDGMFYTPFTTLDGILSKDTGQDPFNAPAAELEAIRGGRHNGRADAALGTVPVNVLTTLDI